MQTKPSAVLRRVAQIARAEFADNERERRRDLREVLSVLLHPRRIRIVAQPIYSLPPNLRSDPKSVQLQLFGVELLTRLVGKSRFLGPEELFCAARLNGLTETFLEVLVRRRMASALKPVRREIGFVFLNGSPYALTQQPLQQLLHEDPWLGLQPKQVVLELTEQEEPDERTTLLQNLALLRQSGAHFAVDDLGAGHSTLGRMLDLRPDFIKLDRGTLIAGIDRDQGRKEMVRDLVRFSHRRRIRVVAEGVEQGEELAVLSQLRVDLVQGFLLARPKALLRG